MSIVNKKDINIKCKLFKCCKTNKDTCCRVCIKYEKCQSNKCFNNPKDCKLSEVL